MSREIDRVDHVLFASFAALTIFGFAMVWSASQVVAIDRYDDSAYYFKRQIMWAFIAAVCALLIYRLKDETLEKYITPLFVFSIILLFAVHIPGLGLKIAGAKRWLQLGPLPAVQPFEFAKVLFVLFAAKIASDAALTPFAKFVRLTGAAAITGVGLVLQRDFGGTMIIAVMYTAFLMMSGVPGYLFAFLVPVIAGGAAILVKVEPYRMKRIFAYLDPWADYFGAGWQTVQSLIAVGTGGLFGAGYSQSQQKFFYLPTPHTDYIYSIIGEEWGLLGTGLVLLAFGLILWRGMFIALHVGNKFHKALAAGLTVMLTTQALVHMGVTTGMLPSKGTTLPFISSGGSALVSAFAAAALLLMISKKVSGSRV